MRRVFLTGISSVVGQSLTRLLLARGHEVAGIDRRPFDDLPRGVEFELLDVRKRGAEEMIRRFRPDAIVHLATVTHLFEQSEERYRINLAGTRAVFEYASQHGVAHVLFVGRHTYYGAGADAPLFHREDEPPAQVGHFPELADLVASDLYAATALWRLPELAITALRICYTLGPSGSGTLASFLRARTRHGYRSQQQAGLRERVVPMVLGYDPLFQFVHETDVVRALCAALEVRPRGVFNVAGPPPLPLSTIVRETGRVPLPLPEPVLKGLLGRFGLPKLSAGALEHIKYPVTIDDSAFRAATGYAPELGHGEILRDFAEAFP